MADERKGHRQQRLEQDPAFGEAAGISGGGAKGGNTARDVASRDQQKRAFERPARPSRVREQDQSESS